MERDRQNTDFRRITEEYSGRENSCLFCRADPSLQIAENELCYAQRDRFPVTELHTLIIPKRHIPIIFVL